MKTLKIKRVFCYVIHLAIKNVAPKDFPTVGEIKSTIKEILPALQEPIGEYLGFVDEAREIRQKFDAKELSEEASAKEVEKLNEKWREYGKAHGEEIVEIKLEKEAFDFFKGQFERETWGKNWMVNIEEYMELNDAFDEAAK
jgi:hypothetical protein